MTTVPNTSKAVNGLKKNQIAQMMQGAIRKIIRMMILAKLFRFRGHTPKDEMYSFMLIQYFSNLSCE